MLKKFLIIIFIVAILAFVLGLGSVYYLLNSPSATQAVVPFVIHQTTEEIRIKGLAIGEQTFDLSKEWSFEDVTADFVVAEEVYSLSFSKLFLDLSGLLQKQSQIKFVLRDLDLRSDSLKIQKGEISLPILFNDHKRLISDGTFSAEGLVFSGLVFNDNSGRIQFDAQQLMLKEVVSHLNDATIRSEIVLDCQAENEYIVKVDVAALDLQSLRPVAAAVVANAQGIVSGSFTVRGDKRGLKALQGSLQSIQEAQVKAALLNLLLDYIPQSTQKKELNALIAANGSIPLDKALIEFDTKDEKILATQYQLKSKKFNFDVNLGLDLNIEGGINNLLKLGTDAF